MGRRIAITGANSAVGRALLELCAAERPHDTSFVACVRSERARGELPELPDKSTVALVSYDAVSLACAFDGANAVIHLPGVLIEKPGSSYEVANVDTTRAVVDAAQRARVAKLVLVSAVGADGHSRNRYYKSKGCAEELVRRSGLAYAILRAPLVLGPGTEGSEAVLRHTRRRRAFLLGGGRHRQQPLDVFDLARAVLRAASLDVARDRTLELAGPEVLADREIVERSARSQGRRVRIGRAPIGPVKLAAALRTRLFGPGLSPDAIDVITADTSVAPGAAEELGIELTPLEATIERMSEGCSE